jgi:hypothetical protein
MLVLFDHGTPRGLSRALPDHAVVTAKARGWDRLNNGALLKSAEEAAIDLLLITDRRIRYQQNLTGRKMAIVVLVGTTKWSRVGPIRYHPSVPFTNWAAASAARLGVCGRDL